MPEKEELRAMLDAAMAQAAFFRAMLMASGAYKPENEDIFHHLSIEYLEFLKKENNNE